MDLDAYNLYLTVNGTSKHSEDKPNGEKWNESNEGLGLKLQKVEDELVISYLLGQYENSIGRDSNYAGVQYQKRLGNEDFHLDAGLLAGLITGYDYPVVPALLPTLSFGTNNFDMNLRYVPKIEGMIPEVWMLNTDYRFK